jgi:thermitase
MRPFMPRAVSWCTLNAGLSDNAVDGIVKPHGGKARRIGKSDLFIVDLPGNASEVAVQARLAHNPQLKFAELDRRVELGFAANDPYLGSQWHLSKINASAAWDVARGQGVTIAILDTGVAASHPDLAANLVPGWNVYGNNADTSDPHGHGTAVAGAAAAVFNNGMGVASVAGAARIMPVRIADANAYAYWSTVAQGLTWAADNGARVANISYVGVAGSSAVQSAAQYMKSKGGLVIVCAGNNGIDEGITPSATMIPVSATNSADAKTSWSSFGAFVAVSAPGQDIWTTTRAGGYQAWWGTSMASPVVAGVVASMMAAKPTLSAAQVESLLFSTAVDLGAAGRDPLYGHGRVNAYAAVAAAASAAAADTQAPTVGITAPGASSTVSGNVTISASASDNVGVTRVELRANGSLLATDITSPYQFAWDTTNLANGNASLVATAFDAAGNSKASSSVTVYVSNATTVVADTTPPVVAISNPVNGGKVSGNVAVKVSATDNAGTSTLRQTLYINGKSVATATGGALNYSWNTRKVATGSYTLQAVAVDAAGNSSSVLVGVTK